MNPNEIDPKKRDRTSTSMTDDSPLGKRVRKPKIYDDYDIGSKSNNNPIPLKKKKQKKPKTPKKDDSKKSLLEKLKKQQNKLESLIEDHSPSGEQMVDLSPSTNQQETPQPLSNPISDIPQNNETIEAVVDKFEFKKEKSPPVTPSKVDDLKKKKKQGTGRKVGRPKKNKEEYEPPTEIKIKKKEKEEVRPKRDRKPKQQFEVTEYKNISKLSSQLQQCFKLLENLKTHRVAWPFLVPVDVIALGLIDYNDIIKTPMDLGTVTSKILNQEYETIHDFAKDVRTIFTNCYTYNPPETDVVKMAQLLETTFEDKFKKLIDEVNSEGYQKKMLAMEQKISQMEKELKERKSLGDLGIQSPIIEKPKNPPKKKPQKKVQTIDSRIMSYEEKRTLSINIGKLDDEKLAKIVEIIQSRAPKASSQATESEIEIDLDKLDPVTLRQVERFVKTAINTINRKKNPKVKKTSNETNTNTTTTQNVQVQNQPIEEKKDQNNNSSDSETESSTDESDSEDSSSEKPIDMMAPKPLVQGN